MGFSPNKYVRRTGGTSKGGGSFSSVVQYGTEAQEYNSTAAYQPSGANHGAFVIASSGVYCVSVTAAAAVGFTLAIKGGAAVDNDLADAQQLAAALDPEGASPTILTCTWVGFLERGEFIWIHHSGTPSANVNDNQISIAQLA